MVLGTYVTQKSSQANLGSKTVYELIQGHGRTDMYLHYATVVGDFERVVEHWVMEEEWTKAIDVLNRQVCSSAMLTIITVHATCSRIWNCTIASHPPSCAKPPKKRQTHGYVNANLIPCDSSQHCSACMQNRPGWDTYRESPACMASIKALKKSLSFILSHKALYLCSSLQLSTSGIWPSRAAVAQWFGRH